ncbi:hypothetical protein ABGB08_37895, partial [Acrocarpospora sp. B8E8]
VEHVLARLKDYQILRQCRREGDAINDAVRGVAALHNLKIDVPACTARSRGRETTASTDIRGKY